MTEFGKTLREARERKGLTIAQIAEQTHLLPQIVEDLEHEDFHRISAPIYGRGFVKLYCEAVGIEPKPLVDEFMAILNGERAPAIRLKEVALPQEGEGGDGGGGGGEELSATPAPVYSQPELGEESAPDEVPPVILTRPGDVRQETRDAGSDLRREVPDLAAGADLSRETSGVAAAMPPPPRQYHPDYARAASSFASGVNFGRLAILAGGAILVIVLLVLGGRALYRASMGITDEAEPVDAASSPRQADVRDERPEARVRSGQTADKRADSKSKSGQTADGKPGAKAKGSKPTDSKPKADAKAKAPQKAAPKRTPKAVPSLYID